MSSLTHFGSFRKAQTNIIIVIVADVTLGDVAARTARCLAAATAPGPKIAAGPKGPGIFFTGTTSYKVLFADSYGCKINFHKFDGTNKKISTFEEALHSLSQLMMVF